MLKQKGNIQRTSLQSSSTSAAHSRFKYVTGMATRYLLIVTALACCRLTVNGDDWSQFRGPNGTGISYSTGLPTEFGPEKNMVWKTALPAGHSSPVLGRDRIFLTGFEGNKLFTICVNLKTGKLLWKQEVPRSRTDRLLNPNNPASPSPPARTATAPRSARRRSAGRRS